MSAFRNSQGDKPAWMSMIVRQLLADIRACEAVQNGNKVDLRDGMAQVLAEAVEPSMRIRMPAKVHYLKGQVDPSPKS